MTTACVATNLPSSLRLQERWIHRAKAVGVLRKGRTGVMWCTVTRHLPWTRSRTQTYLDTARDSIRADGLRCNAMHSIWREARAKGATPWVLHAMGLFPIERTRALSAANTELGIAALPFRLELELEK